MAKGQRDLVREQHWRERVAEWVTSGLSIRAFCDQHQLTETTFHHWRRELRVREEAASSSPARPRFVPVTVLPNGDPLTRSVGPVDVRCPSGHVVTVPVGDTATLRTLFAALASLAGEDSPC